MVQRDVFPWTKTTIVYLSDTEDALFHSVVSVSSPPRPPPMMNYICLAEQIPKTETLSQLYFLCQEAFYDFESLVEFQLENPS